MIIKLNTDICPIISVGMYGTMLEPETESLEYEITDSKELTEEEKDKAIKLISDNFNMERYKEHLRETAVEFLQQCFDDYDGNNYTEEKLGIKIISSGIYSPREYNYRNDELDFEIVIRDDIVAQIIIMLYIDPIIKDGFFNKMEVSFGSYCGFISSMPIRQKEYIEALTGKDIERAIAMFLYFLLYEEDFQNDFNSRVIEGYNEYEYIDSDEFFEIYNKTNV